MWLFVRVEVYEAGIRVVRLGERKRGREWQYSVDRKTEKEKCKPLAVFINMEMPFQALS
jgi:hypothetical protein